MRSSSVLLWCLLSSLHSVLAAGSSAEPNVDVLSDNFYFTGNGSKYLFWRDLRAGDTTGTVDIIKNNSAPAVAAGSVPYSEQLISEIVSVAAANLTDHGHNHVSISSVEQSGGLYGQTLSQVLFQLTKNRTSLISGFALAISSSISWTQSGTSEAILLYHSSYISPRLSDVQRTSLIGPLFYLAYSAGLDQSVPEAFALIQRGSEAGLIPLPAVALGLYYAVNVGSGTIEPPQDGIIRAAAVSVFGATPSNLHQAKGNTTAIGSLLFGTAYLGPGDPSAVAQNLSEVLQGSNLPGEIQKEALAQAIKQALVPPSNIQEAFAQVVLPQAMQQLVPNATAALVAAAVAANQVAAVAEGFTMALYAPLQVLCRTEATAQNISRAAGQAVSSAIPAVFGAAPCKPYTGPESYMYTATNEKSGPQTRCDRFYSGAAAKTDCMAAVALLRARAVAEVRAKASSTCTVGDNPLFKTATTSGLANFRYFANSTVLADAGTCQLQLGGSLSTALPCSQIATYTENIVNVCGDGASLTGGILYPNGDHFGNSTYIAVLQKLPEGQYCGSYSANGTLQC